MRRDPASRALRTGLIVAALQFSGHAFAFDLDGAWASERDLCARVFAKKDGVVGFAEMSDLYGSGFIVDGDSIKGKAAKCTIRSRQQDGDTTVLTASCSTSIMTSDLQFRYKVVDDNTLNREYSEIKDMTLRFSRCPM